RSVQNRVAVFSLVEATAVLLHCWSKEVLAIPRRCPQDGSASNMVYETQDSLFHCHSCLRSGTAGRNSGVGRALVARAASETLHINPNWATASAYHAARRGSRASTA